VSLADDLLDLEPWQRPLAAALLNGHTVTGGRRSGRSQIIRWATLRAAGNGEHTHFLAADGLWCVTRQPVGYLWALVRRPGPRCQSCGKARTP
jgi:hypothetical protein